ncbi:hypothetical protein BCR37DRAFT_385914 [Protomyces lactucae-debilis]|uniref:Uncharacterized protein n=1 Tax=Protomyces lactucae-debilis TaxID=2754530 RepID=A0A1Y2FS01_PROLT|nr:uncharacterized protein BCR37DRAFT_385914 [Protomyces lactucae-debilis]ORY85485.1 hypothetical protein BCR37DRAFT_385914 [Protomyces lactucae-debilis]
MAHKSSTDTPNKQQQKAHQQNTAKRDNNNKSLTHSGNSGLLASSIQSMGTPAKKSDLYAGPTFHHSPAPAKLPPPPFLSSSASSQQTIMQQFAGMMGGGLQQQQQQQQPLQSGMTADEVVDASPLGFLFRAKEREERVAGEPSSLSHHALSMHLGQQQLHHPTNRHSPPLSVDYTDDDESVFADLTSPVQPATAQFQGPASIQAVKKPAWQPIERPPTLSLAEIQREPEEVMMPVAERQVATKRPKKAASGVSTPQQQQTRKSTNVHDKQQQRSMKQEGGDSAPKSQRRKRKDVTAVNGSPSLPKMILKREPAASGSGGELSSSSPPPVQASTARKSKATRQSSASEFQPLKKPSPQPVHATPTILKRAKDEVKQASASVAIKPASLQGEDDDAQLLREASNLVKLLSLNPATEQDRPMTPLSNRAALQQSAIGTPRETAVSSGMATPQRQEEQDGDRSLADQQTELALHRMLGLSQPSSSGGTPTSFRESGGEKNGHEVTPSTLEMDLRKLLHLSA